jgi:hypothetical protein
LPDFDVDWLINLDALGALRSLGQSLVGMSLGEVIDNVDPVPAALIRSALFHLLWCSEFRVDLAPRLTPSTVIEEAKDAVWPEHGMPRSILVERKAFQRSLVASRVKSGGVDRDTQPLAMDAYTRCVVGLRLTPVAAAATTGLPNVSRVRRSALTASTMPKASPAFSGPRLIMPLRSPPAKRSSSRWR